jgi:hypothetical protein
MIRAQKERTIPQPLGYGDFLADIEHRFGLTFTCEDTGGGCLLFQARLDNGEWIVISDWDSGITPLEKRDALEDAGITVGWNVSIFADDGDNWPDHTVMMASIRHDTAHAHELPSLIEQALASRPATLHHDYRNGAGHTVSYGIQRV